MWPAAVPPADEQVHLQAGNREGPACHLSWCCLVVQAGMTSCSLHRSALGPLVSSTACGIRSGCLWHLLRAAILLCAQASVRLVLCKRPLRGKDQGQCLVSSDQLEAQ